MAEVNAATGAITSQPPPNGQTLTVTFSTQYSPTSAEAMLVPVSALDGSLTTFGTVQLGADTGTASFTNIPPGTYTLSVSVTNEVGTSFVTGAQTVQIFAITG
ncbi:triple tyrosine motif-containing protein, partial [Cronobacter muytjensii]|uniref:triple tyrosine motif-containing protein n=1 Tax=Cronobacter muytjensii TaxID=413501 RepID=UPI0034D470EB